MHRIPAIVLAGLFFLSESSIATAADALVAVATNFAGTAAELEADFESISRHRVTLASGSTGHMYAQIVHGAPFDLLLAADQTRPALLQKDGLGVAESQFTYAIGRLTLCSSDSTLILADLTSTLAGAEIRSFALANPELAPYGMASRTVLQNLGFWDRLQGVLVFGQNVGQAFALVATGNATLGLIAQSSMHEQASAQQLACLDVPEGLHAPVLQDAILLRHGKSNSAAQAFHAYLQQERARDIIRRRGYGLN